METVVIQKNAPPDTIQKNLITGTYALEDFLGELDKITESAKSDIRSVLLTTINGMNEQVRDQGTHLVLENTKGISRANELVKKFDVISKGLISDNNDLPFLSWMHFMAHTFLEEQYRREHAAVLGNADEEWAVYEKYYHTTNFISDQLINELESNVCTWGEFLYNFMNLKLSHADEIFQVLGLVNKKYAENFLKHDISKKETEDEVARRELVSMVLDMDNKQRKGHVEKNAFINVVNAYVKDRELHSVYDLFTRYIEMGHPSLINLHQIKTENFSADEFYRHNKAVLGNVEDKFNAAVMSKGAENALAKQDLAREFIADTLTILGEEVKNKIDVIFAMNLDYEQNKLRDIFLDVDLVDRETGIPMIDDRTVEVRKEIFKRLLVNAKHAVSDIRVKK